MKLLSWAKFLVSDQSFDDWTVGIFDLVNSLEEPISVGIGFYKKSARVGVTPREGDFGARPLTAQPVAAFAAQSTNVFEMWVPTKGGLFSDN